MNDLEYKMNDKRLLFYSENLEACLGTTAENLGSYEKGKAIAGLENIRDSYAFHVGTTLETKQVKPMVPEF